MEGRKTPSARRCPGPCWVGQVSVEQCSGVVRTELNAMPET